MKAPRPLCRAHGSKACRRWGLILLWTLAFNVLAQSSPSLTLHRSDAQIVLVNEGRGSEGARTLLNVPRCVPDEQVRTSTFYAPGSDVVARITQNDDGSETLVRAPLMTVQRPEGDEGSEAETLEALDATATFESGFVTDTEAATEPWVVLEQGTTTVRGERFFLDRGTDVATMDGPVDLLREPTDGPRLTAEAESLRFDLDTDRSTLTGSVRVVSGERVSTADELELNEAAGVAILRGSPAVSREGEDEVRGARLRYDLETNDVVVEGAVSASFDWGDSGEEVPSSGTP